MRALLLGTLCSAVTLGSIAVAQDGDWPYPQDIPSPEPAAVGLAGADEANIVRFLKVIGVGASQISPDGSMVAYTTSITGEPQVWSVPTAGGLPSQLTFGTGVSGFEFAPDGRLLIEADTEGDERVGYTLLSPDGLSETRLLTPTDAFNSFGDFAPDGERIVFSTTRRNGTDFDIYVADAGTGEEREVYEGKFGFFPQAWRPGSDEVLVTETRGEDGAVLHLLDVETGELTTLLDPEVTSDYSSLVWTEDGDGFYLSTNYEREYSALAYFDMSAFEAGTAAPDALSFLETPERDVELVRLAGDDRYLLWTENEEGYSRLKARDLRRNRSIDLPALPDGVYSVSAASDAAIVSVRVSGPSTPGTLYAVDLKDREPTLLVAPQHAGLDLSSFTAPTPVTFPARDGVTLHGLLYMPDGGSEPPPVVLQVHGGPSAQARPTFEPVTEYLLERGVAVLELNFRGSTGFGKTFARLDNQRLRPNAVRDVADAVAYLKERDDVDGDTVAIMGGSYGGYLTNAAMGEFPDLFAAGVSFVGVSDWVRALQEASPFLKASDVIEYGDIRDPENLAFFEEISPIAKVDQITAPMMFLHGANDPRDPVTESDHMVEALRERGVEVRYLRFPDEGHGIRKIDNRVHAYRQVADFLETHLLETRD